MRGKIIKTIFIVDDNETNLMTAKLTLEGKYKSYAIPSAARMFKLAEKIMPDLILLDVDMPDMDGFEVMEAITSHERLKAVPVLLLTARSDPESEIRGFEMGALDFISKPFSPPVLLRRIKMYIEADKIIKEGLKFTRSLYKATIGAIAVLVDSREQDTGLHVMRTQKYFTTLVKHIMKKAEYKDKMSDWDMETLESMTLMHDIGKISISDTILNKQGKLTNEEFEIVKNHCAESEKLIDLTISKTREWQGFLQRAKCLAAMHHEKWDGTGYPKGLSGEQICLEARIFAVANVYDALTNKRPFRQAFSHDQAVKLIQEESGKHFDPKIVEAFLEVSEDFWLESISMG